MTAQDANPVQPDHEAESAPSVSHLLIVDDEQQLLVTLQLSLTKRGFQVSTAADGTTALQLVRDTQPDLVLLDLGLPDIDAGFLERTPVHMRRIRLGRPALEENR
jgi:DNA-binding response OmpR family regulator